MGRKLRPLLLVLAVFRGWAPISNAFGGRQPPLLFSLAAHSVMLILPCASIPVVRVTFITIDRTPGNVLPASAGANKMPLPRRVNLTTDENVARR